MQAFLSVNVKAADVSTIFNRASVQLCKIAKFLLFYIHTILYFILFLHIPGPRVRIKLSKVETYYYSDSLSYGGVDAHRARE